MHVHEKHIHCHEDTSILCAMGHAPTLGRPKLGACPNRCPNIPTSSFVMQTLSNCDRVQFVALRIVCNCSDMQSMRGCRDRGCAVLGHAPWGYGGMPHRTVSLVCPPYVVVLHRLTIVSCRYVKYLSVHQGCTHNASELQELLAVKCHGACPKLGAPQHWGMGHPQHRGTPHPRLYTYTQIHICALYTNICTRPLDSHRAFGARQSMHGVCNALYSTPMCCILLLSMRMHVLEVEWNADMSKCIIYVCCI